MDGKGPGLPVVRRFQGEPGAALGLLPLSPAGSGGWSEARDVVWVTACLLRDGFWKHARWHSSLIASGACLDETVAVRPDKEPVVAACLYTRIT